MIKIIIKDVTQLNEIQLQTTAQYLLALLEAKTAAAKDTAQEFNAPHISIHSPTILNDASFASEEALKLWVATPDPRTSNLGTSINFPEFNFPEFTPPVIAELKRNCSDLPMPPPPLTDTFKSTVEVPTVNTELDSARLPWDARIHVASKTKTVKNKWKYKRELDKEFIKKIEDELRLALNLPMPPLAPPPPSSLLNVPINAPTLSYPGLLLRIGAALNSQKLTHEQYFNILNSLGISDPAMLPTRADLFPALAAQLEKLGG